MYVKYAWLKSTLQPVGVNLSYFIFRYKDLGIIENLSLWQKLYSFSSPFKEKDNFTLIF